MEQAERGSFHLRNASPIRINIDLLPKEARKEQKSGKAPGIAIEHPSGKF